MTDAPLELWRHQSYWTAMANPVTVGQIEECFMQLVYSSMSHQLMKCATEIEAWVTVVYF
jgi:hypothetical protein